MSGGEGGDAREYETPQEQVESVVEKNRSIITYTIIGLVAVLVVVGIVVFAVSRGDGKEAAPTTTTTSTTEASTTTTTVDPRQKYVGLQHDDRGAGLALGTEIRSVGYRSGFDGAIKTGDYAYFWVRDDKGDMLWLDQITKAPKNAEPVQAKVTAVWDLPAVVDEQALCLGWCYDANSNPDASVVGIFDANAAPLKMWRIDALKPSMDSIPAKGWRLYPEYDEMPTIPIPERPELYGTVALANTDDRATYTALEQVSAGGGGSYGDSFIFDVNDYKESKSAAVITRNGTVSDTIVTEMASGATFNFSTPENPQFKYDGKPDGNVIAYVSYKDAKLDKVYAAWRIDPKTYKFTAIDKSKVTAAG